MMKTINIFEVKDIEALWGRYLADHKYFYRCGDERDSIPRWDIRVPNHITEDAQHCFDELKVRANEIETVASTYQISLRKDDEETHALKAEDYHKLIQG